MNSFLTQLEHRYCWKTYPNFKVSSMDCFGYNDNDNKPLSLFENGVLTSTTVVYTSNKINPEKCIEHISTLIASNPELNTVFWKKAKIKSTTQISCSSTVLSPSKLTSTPKGYSTSKSMLFSNTATPAKTKGTGISLRSRKATSTASDTQDRSSFLSSSKTIKATAHNEEEVDLNPRKQRCRLLGSRCAIL